MNDKSGSMELAPLRQEINDLDDQIMALLEKRLKCCHEVAKIKQKHNIPVVIEERINAVIARAGKYAKARDLDVEFYETVYKQIIDATCKVELTYLKENAWRQQKPLTLKSK